MTGNAIVKPPYHKDVELFSPIIVLYLRLYALVDLGDIF